MVPQWTMADRLRKARELTGMDQTEFAAAMGVNRNTIGTAEGGTKTPRRLTVRMWAMITGVDQSWLETGRPTTPGGGLDELRARRDSNPQPSDPKEKGSPVRGLLLSNRDAA